MAPPSKNRRPDQRISAHRGAKAEAPENTMAAFERAIAAGAGEIETDVRLAADGVPVLFHDPDLKRIADADQRVEDLPLAALQAIDVGSRFAPSFAAERIPTLAQLVRLCRETHTRLLLDLKVESCCAAIRQDLAAARLDAELVTICTWNDAQVADVDHNLPHLAKVQIRAKPCTWSAAKLTSIVELGFLGLSVKHIYITPELIAAAHAAGLSVRAWTVNETNDMTQLIAAGIDTVITDDPAKLARLLAS